MDDIDYKMEAAELAIAALAYGRALQCITDGVNGENLARAYLGEVNTRARRVLGLHVFSGQGESHANSKENRNQESRGRREEGDLEQIGGRHKEEHAGQAR